MHVRADECALGCDSTLQKLSKIGQEHPFCQREGLRLFGWFHSRADLPLYYFPCSKICYHKMFQYCV